MKKKLKMCTECRRFVSADKMIKIQSKNFYAVLCETCEKSFFEDNISDFGDDFEFEFVNDSLNEWLRDHGCESKQEVNNIQEKQLNTIINTKAELKKD